MVPLSFAGHDFLALPEAALFWPARSALLVADLHFEKASWFARFGQFLPPHDSHATLDMIEMLVERTGARAVWSLGDSFHDADGAARLDPAVRARLALLTDSRSSPRLRRTAPSGLKPPSNPPIAATAWAMLASCSAVNCFTLCWNNRWATTSSCGKVGVLDSLIFGAEA